MSDNMQTPNEEVDLGKLFTIIGNGFKNIFAGILNIFKAVFHYLILGLIFFKKNAIVLGVATLLGGALGYVMDMNKEKMYSSQMILETNFGSGHQLYSQNGYLNTLIAKEDLKILSKIFNISNDEAKALRGFVVQPYEQDKNILKEYDSYIQNTDTIYTEGFTIEDFTKRKKEPDFRLQLVTASATTQDVFSKLSSGIAGLIENAHYKLLLQAKKEDLDARKLELEKNLKVVDSLRKRYRRVALLNAEKNGASGTNISLVEQTSTTNKDIDLFNEARSTLRMLGQVKNERIAKSFIASVISDFSLGKMDNSIIGKKWFRYALLGFVLILLVILGKKMNTYLNEYKKNI